MSQIEKTCGYFHKISHLKDHCHWNLQNPNNKLKEKEVLVKKMSTQSNRGIESQYSKQGNQNQGGNTSPTIYWCFICNLVEHKIYDCPHKSGAKRCSRTRSPPSFLNSIISCNNLGLFWVCNFKGVLTHNYRWENVYWFKLHIYKGYSRCHPKMYYMAQKFGQR